MKLEIKWNAELFGVEIQTEGEHFVIDANPSYVMSWHDAVRFYKNPHRSHTWGLPTKKQLEIVSKHLGEVNALIKLNGGYEIWDCHWTADEYHEFCAWNVFMTNGSTLYYNKHTYYYVRAVSALDN